MVVEVIIILKHLSLRIASGDLGCCRRPLSCHRPPPAAVSLSPVTVPPTTVSLAAFP